MRSLIRLLEVRHQFVENPPRNLPAIVAILKLFHVLPKVLPGNVDVGSADRKLEARPKAFDAVGMNRSPDIFACAVVHRIVIKTGAPQAQVGAKLVSYDCGAALATLLSMIGCNVLLRTFGTTLAITSPPRSVMPNTTALLAL